MYEVDICYGKKFRKEKNIYVEILNNNIRAESCTSVYGKYYFAEIQGSLKFIVHLANEKVRGQVKYFFSLKEPLLISKVNTKCLYIIVSFV